MIGLIALTGLIAAPAGAADCNQAENLLSNCDFTTDMTDWYLSVGDWWRHDPTDGATAPGCVEVDAAFDGANHYVQIESICVPTTAGATYDLGFSVRVTSGPPGGTCVARAHYFTDTSCSFHLAFQYVPSFSADSTWQQTFESQVAPATAGSAMFGVLCNNPSDPSDFQVRIDDALFGQGLVPVELMSFSVE